ncbi:MAG: PilT/PilU family type 4a pilus ATPase [Verrucomicrobium sp.]|nr:PilT/PilU family type 4a pilus ATPase [Verrucomicrobium sp.]
MTAAALQQSAENDLVLRLALEHSLINSDQYHATSSMLAGQPSLPAVELLYEQQLIDGPQRDWFHQVLASGLAQQAARQAIAAQAAEPEPRQAAAPPPLAAAGGAGPFAHVDDYLREALAAGVSDVHLAPSNTPAGRRHGQLRILREGLASLSAADTERLAHGFLDPRMAARVRETGAAEFCHELETGPGQPPARFRTSVIRQRRGWEMVFRVIPGRVPTLAELGMPETLRTLTRYHNGLVLVTGPSGSGKSTTLAAMVEQINAERRDHIITLEEPIEYVFSPRGCQISQREVGAHTKTYGSALRAALREDPDVIVVGEMRDLETISLAITAAETGHLVLGTLHTNSAPRTLNRLLDAFPISQQAQIRTMVSESIRGIVCQQLVPRADGQGRAMAMEIMTNTPAVAALIRDGKTFMLPGIIQTGVRQGMVLMDDSLLSLVDQNLITAEEAYRRSENKKTFAQELARRHRS